MKILRTAAAVLILPVLLIKDTVTSAKSAAAKAGYVILILVFWGSMWLGGFTETRSFISYYLYEFGITDRLQKVQISGTSMLPTIKDGSEVELLSPKKHGVHRLDIVSFANSETGGVHYIKRVIGLPDETVMLKNGYVYINGRAISEPYILNDLPTYGNTFMSDCEGYTVPEGFYLVLGDNRTVSSDSRVLGYVKADDIGGVINTGLTLSYQPEDPEPRTSASSLDTAQYISLLNKLREKSEAGPLVPSDKLDSLAKTRAAYVSGHFTDWVSGTTLEKAADDAGYSYTLLHEFVSYGNVSGSDLVNQISELPLEREYFTSDGFFDIGIDVTTATHKECSFPVVDTLISHPTTPTYAPEIVSYWAKEMTGATKALAFLQTGVGRAGVDQVKLQNAIHQVSQDLEVATRIHKKMTAGDWLSDKDNQDISGYTDHASASEALIEDLLGSPPGSGSSGTQPAPASETVSPTPKPAASAPASAKLSSTGLQKTANGGGVTLNTATDTGSALSIHVTFANLSSSAITLAPIRTQMRSPTLGASVEPGIPTLSLGAGETRGFDFTVRKLSDTPYTFYYVDSDGNSLNLGTYTP